MPKVVMTTDFRKILGLLAAGLDIRLSYSEEEMTNQGVDDYAICTLPLDVFAGGTIVFGPALLEDCRENIAKLGFGSTTMIGYKFEEAFEH